MVLVQSPVNKKLSHTLSITYPNHSSTDKKMIKKAMKLNKIKKRNKILFESSGETFEPMKSNNYFGTQYEKEIIPRTQNNTERTFRKTETYLDESDHFEEPLFNWKMDDDQEDENSLEFQYGTLLGNEKVTTCVKKFLSDWDSFIGDIGSDETDTQMNSISKMEEDKITNCQEWIPNNSGYLTPTSQKDEEICSEKAEAFEQESEESTSEKVSDHQNEHDEEEFTKNSPAIIDDFDDICPFENDYGEDERIRNILNAEVLPSDYIGKIPSIPEKPIGHLGRLMKKYNF